LDEASLILSVVGIFLSLVIAAFAIWFQWQISIESANQLTQASTVLAKIEGVALQLRETQEGQFEKLLDAYVASNSMTARGATHELQEVDAKLNQIEEQQPNLADALAEVRASVKYIRESLNELERHPALTPELAAKAAIA
jgi:hypothetical protein